MREENSPGGRATVGALFHMPGFVFAACNGIGLAMPFRKEDPGRSCKFVATGGGVMTATMAVGAGRGRRGSVDAAGISVVGRVYFPAINSEVQHAIGNLHRQGSVGSAISQGALSGFTAAPTTFRLKTFVPAVERCPRQSRRTRPLTH